MVLTSVFDIFAQMIAVACSLCVSVWRLGAVSAPAEMLDAGRGKELMWERDCGWGSRVKERRKSGFILLCYIPFQGGLWFILLENLSVQLWIHSHRPHPLYSNSDEDFRKHHSSNNKNGNKHTSIFKVRRTKVINKSHTSCDLGQFRVTRPTVTDLKQKAAYPSVQPPLLGPRAVTVKKVKISNARKVI